MIDMGVPVASPYGGYSVPPPMLEQQPKQVDNYAPSAPYDPQGEIMAVENT
jgi:hypothetical protein